MSVASLVFGAGVLAALAAIAVADAKRMTIPPPWLGLLVASGLGWLATGGLAVAGGGWERHAAGAAAGLGVPFAFILGAQALGRRWPIFPGDAWLLGAAGAVLGVRGLLWAMAAGSALALAHRACLQRKRGRPFAAGYLPAGPGLAAGAAAVFVALNAGIALGDGHANPVPADPLRIEATELPPVKIALPDALAGKEVAIDVPSPMAFAELVGRIGRAAGVGVAIEERPSRVAGGDARLADPAPALPGNERRLGALIDGIAARAGYGWEWKDDGIVFYRYWDEAWIAARPVSGPEPEVADAPEVSGDSAGGLIAWLGRVFGGGRKKGPESAETAGAPDSATAAAAAAQTGGRSGQSGEKKDDSAEAAPAVEAEPAFAEAVGVAWAPAEEPLVWEVDPAGQGTLRGVLEAWAERAEWKIAWRAERDFRVGAAAKFEGGFLEAVDSLLSDPGVSRVLTARAHANRYLVVEGTRP